MSGLDSLIENQGFYDYLNHLVSGSVFIIGFEAIVRVFGESLILQAYDFIGLLDTCNKMNTFLWNMCVIAIWITTAFLIGVTIQELYWVIYRRTGKFANMMQSLHICNACINSRGKLIAPLCNVAQTFLTKISVCVGPLLHMIKKSRLFNKTTIEKCMKNLFISGGPITNENKRIEYRKLAESFVLSFPQNYDNFDRNVENDKVASSIFSHCSYYIQIKNQNRKTEKLRDIAGLSESLSLESMLLAIASVICIPFNISMCGILICYFVVFVIFSILMDLRAEKSHKNRIRMTLGLYAAEKANEKS